MKDSVLRVGSGQGSALVLPGRRGRLVRRTLAGLGKHGSILAVGVFFALPLLWMVATAFKRDRDILRQFYRTIPEELCDAGRIDGASEFGIFSRIVLPLSKPALAVVIITTFLFRWNEFLVPLIYLTSPQNFTMALGLADFQGPRQILWNLLMAASVVFTLPIVVAFFFAQKQFIPGIKLTGVKE
jgi:ABC-type glycerol-3-phosphate transport system permease component